MSPNAQVLDSPVFETLPIVEAELSYLIPMVEKPVNYTYEPPPGIPRHNGKYEIKKLAIRDARPIAQNFSLDREGFAFVTHNSNVRDFYDEEEIERVYYPEAEQLLKDVTGASQVVIFDHTLRNARRLQQGETWIKEPAKRVV